MSKALEAARRAIESHPAYDCGSTGDEEMARAAISAYLSALAEDEEVVERVARALNPRAWEVMDDGLHQMQKKYAGQNVGWPASQFQHKESMEQSRAALRALKDTKP